MKKDVLKITPAPLIEISGRNIVGHGTEISRALAVANFLIANFDAYHDISDLTKMVNNNAIATATSKTATRRWLIPLVRHVLLERGFVLLQDRPRKATRYKIFDGKTAHQEQLISEAIERAERRETLERDRKEKIQGAKANICVIQPSAAA